MHVHLSLHFEAGVCLWNVGSMYSSTREGGDKSQFSLGSL